MIIMLYSKVLSHSKNKTTRELDIELQNQPVREDPLQIETTLTC